MEDNEELSEEEIKKNEDKAKRIQKKLDAFMEDVSADLMDEELFGLARKRIVSHLKKGGIPLSVSYLKAMKEGMQMATGAHQADASYPMMLIVAISKMISEADTKKQVDQAMNNINLKNQDEPIK